jgi:predicted kinase
MIAGLDVIIDNTHFKPEHEWRYRALAEEHGYQFEIVSFEDVPLEECIRRDEERPNRVGESVILRMEAYRKSLVPYTVVAAKKRTPQK